MSLKDFDTLDGRIVQAEEILPEFSQADLASDDVMILDTWDQVGPSFVESVCALLEISAIEFSPNLRPTCQIFIWIGKDAREDEKKGSSKIGLYFWRARETGGDARC